MIMATGLELKDVSKKYLLEENEILALEHISFSVKKRESIAIVGPSGCGKTTLIRMIGGLESPSAGKITLDGVEIRGPNQNIMMILSQ